MEGAFVAALGTPSAGCRTGRAFAARGAAARAVSRRSSRVRMMAETTEKPDTVEEPTEEGQTKEEILAQLKAEVEADPLKSTGQFDGRTWDGDGRRNNWAIEPMESVEATDRSAQNGRVAVAVAGIVVALIAILPFLNFSNPDQL